MILRFINPKNGFTIEVENNSWAHENVVKQGFVLEGETPENYDNEPVLIEVINPKTKEEGLAYRYDGTEESLKKATEIFDLEPIATCFEKGSFTVKMKSGEILVEKDLKKYQVKK